MRERGWVEGQNLALERRFPEGKNDRPPDLAAELIRLKVDVIFAINTPATLAAKNATSTVPIVFTGVGANPTANRLIGTTVTRIAVLWHAPNAGAAAILRDIEVSRHTEYASSSWRERTGCR